MMNREVCQTPIQPMKNLLIILTLLPSVWREGIAHLENLTKSPHFNTVKCFIPFPSHHTKTFLYVII